jgi:hypothetical protein
VTNVPLPGPDPMKELQKCSAESEEEGQTLELQVHAEESGQLPSRIMPQTP